MAKARTLVGLDVHATKIVAAVLDADSGQLQSFTMGGETARRPLRSARGFRGRSGWPMRQGLRGTGSRARSPGAGWSVSWRRRARSPRASGHGGAAKELADQRAAALGVVEERGVAPGDDLEARVGYERAGVLADLWAAVGILVAPDHEHGQRELPQIGL